MTTKRARHVLTVHQCLTQSPGTSFLTHMVQSLACLGPE